MAFLDNKNDNLYPKGDPLEELDRELAELKSALDQLDPDASPAQENPADTAEPPCANQSEPAPTAEEDDVNEDAAPEETEDHMKHADNRSLKPAAIPAGAGRNPGRYAKASGKSRLPLIIVGIILAAALVVGIGVAARKWLPSPEQPNAATTDEYVSDGRTIVVNDSELGVVEVTPPVGTKMNTYSADNLTYDENGIPVYYENGEKISHLGVDLSEFQSSVDFTAMKNAGVEFVMLRVGGRYYGEGGLYQDKNFETFYARAKDAGLKVGAYFLSQAITPEEAKEEADYAIQTLGGKQLDFPIAFDWENIAEDDARTDNVTNEELTKIAEAFCDAVNSAGYKSIVYSNAVQMMIQYDFDTMKDYDFWLADYREFPTMPYKFNMWQYTKEGVIDGFDGTVDLDISFTDFSD